MPSQTFSLLSKIAHHLYDDGVWLLCISQGGLNGRLRMVWEKVLIAKDRVSRIETIAREKGYNDILAILNEPYEGL